MKKTLNVGAGGRTYETYPAPNFKCINLDARALPNINVVADVTNLHMFLPGEFDYILASDIIEHFPISKTVDVLKEWVRVLKLGGIIEFRLPNLAAICRQYFAGGQNAKNISWLLYGGQDYPGNFHYVGFDRAFFKEVCSSVGLFEVSYQEVGFNMIIKYRTGGIS